MASNAEAPVALEEPGTDKPIEQVAVEDKKEEEGVPLAVDLGQGVPADSEGFVSPFGTQRDGTQPLRVAEGAAEPTEGKDEDFKSEEVIVPTEAKETVTPLGLIEDINKETDGV